MRVRFTQTSRNRLKEIYQYYLDKSQREAGRKIGAKIRATIKRLIDFPYLGPEDEFSKSLGLEHRYLIEGHYKIIYRIVDNEILVVEIFDTRQDPDKMLPP
jgi:plasmid stabilization system protein ParE